MHRLILPVYSFCSAHTPEYVSLVYSVNHFSPTVPIRGMSGGDIQRASTCFFDRWGSELYGWTNPCIHIPLLLEEGSAFAGATAKQAWLSSEGSRIVSERGFCSFWSGLRISVCGTIWRPDGRRRGRFGAMRCCGRTGRGNRGSLSSGQLTPWD